MVTLAFLLAFGLVASFILAVVVPFVASPAMVARLGRFRAGVLGIVICALLAIIGILIWNPDHIGFANRPEARFWDAVQLGAASAVFWLPVYLFGLSRRFRRGGGA